MIREPGNLPSDRVSAAGCPATLDICSGRFFAHGISPRAADKAPQLDTPEERVPQKNSFSKIPATIITGFLGAGKTTLIRHVLQHANGRRLALIINEFGDVGIDGEILRSCGAPSCGEDEIIELANGCICCTVADDFLPAIEKLLARDPRPDHIVIETSGLALPKPLVKAFDWPPIRAKLTVDGVIAVVDGAAVASGRFADDPARLDLQRGADPAIAHENPLEEVFEDQLLCADLIVLNKADLISPKEQEAIVADIAGRVPRAVKIVPAREGRLDPSVLIGLEAAAESDLDVRPSHHDAESEHDHDDFESFVVDFGPVESSESFLAGLSDIAARQNVLRIKGFVDVRDKPMRLLVQGVGSRFQSFFDRPWRPGEARQSRLVIIGEKGSPRAAIAQEIKSLCGPKAA
jgi:cobalamin biosynthesis protein CobW